MQFFTEERRIGFCACCQHCQDLEQDRRLFCRFFRPGLRVLWRPPEPLRPSINPGLQYRAVVLSYREVSDRIKVSPVVIKVLETQTEHEVPVSRLEFDYHNSACSDVPSSCGCSDDLNYH